MKPIVAFIKIFLITIASYSQETFNLEKKIDSLKRIKTELQSKIADVDMEYYRIESLLKQIKFENAVGEIYYSVAATNLTKTPDKYDMVIHLPSNKKVRVLDYSDKYYKINYNDSIGWVLKVALISESERQKIAAEKKAKEFADKMQFQKYKDDLIKKYGASDAQRILSGIIWLGMKDEMARISKGSPTKINRTVGSWGVHEQWVYDSQNLYLYFENGILTSWQD